MVLSFDLDSGRLSLVNPVTLTLSRPGSPLSRLVANCQEQQQRKMEQSGSAAILETTDTAFNLWTAELASMEPLSGDQVTKADGSVFVVVGVDRCVHGHRFRVHSRRQKT